MAGKGLSRGQVENLWQALNFRMYRFRGRRKHFRKVRYRFRCTHCTFARSGKEFLTAAELSQGQVENTFARSGPDCVAGAEVRCRFCGRRKTFKTSWQAQHFHKVRYRVLCANCRRIRYRSRSRHSILFARSIDDS